MTEEPSYIRQYETRRNEQSLFGAILGGALCALAGTALWALAEYSLLTEAICMGALTGFGVRLFGKGIERRFGLLGVARASSRTDSAIDSACPESAWRPTWTPSATSASSPISTTASRRWPTG